jgi:hypothetical protein
MNIKQLISGCFVVVILISFAYSQAKDEIKILTDENSLRQMLANQPDYSAIEKTVFLEKLGGFSGESNVIKSGNRSVEMKADTIFISVPGKPLVRIFPKDKTYALSQPEKDDNIFSPQKLAADKNAVFSYLGKEKIENYDSIKIEVSLKGTDRDKTKNKRLESSKLVFWLVPELKNLIIRSETTLGNDAKFINSLREISLSVNEESFHIPKGFKKINY